MNLRGIANRGAVYHDPRIMKKRICDKNRRISNITNQIIFPVEK